MTETKIKRKEIKESHPQIYHLKMEKTPKVHRLDIHKSSIYTRKFFIQVTQEV